MGVVTDMILAVAMVAAALGAVAELQLGICYIGTAADTAFMGIGCLNRGRGSCVGASAGELNGACPLFAGIFALITLKQPGGIGPPGHRKDIFDICAKEQEIVCKSKIFSLGMNSFSLIALLFWIISISPSLF